MDLIEELEKLDAMYNNGTLTDEEFVKAKDALLAKYQSSGQKFKQAVGDLSSDESVWGVLIHLSQFGGYLIPLGGWLLPICLWLIKRNDSETIDRHGRIVINWIISQLIYGILFTLLCFVLIGIPLLIVLGIVAFVYPIVGAVKASSGEVWDYPGNLRFL
ncbi:DUF4870 domain-containing protein [Pontiella sp.]|uniref:DUF4870 domain-containing protein n=1 Tax=Pontiella sp. TaxID=2837462 RepID=UPI003561CBED